MECTCDGKAWVLSNFKLFEPIEPMPLIRLDWTGLEKIFLCHPKRRVQSSVLGLPSYPLVRETHGSSS
eukprot:1157226-Pelagomonas_calceolata.AAC.3